MVALCVQIRRSSVLESIAGGEDGDNVTINWLSTAGTIALGFLLLTPQPSQAGSIVTLEFEGQLVDVLGGEGNPVGSFTGFVSWDSESPDLFLERDDVGVFTPLSWRVEVSSSTLGDWVFTPDNSVGLFISRTDSQPGANRVAVPQRVSNRGSVEA